jgi:hypothetical protein
MNRFFSPLGYIGAIVLVFLGLSPQNVADWIKLYLSIEISGWVSSDSGRWTFVILGVALFFITHARQRRQGHPTLSQGDRPPATSSGGAEAS